MDLQQFEIDTNYLLRRIIVDTILSGWFLEKEQGKVKKVTYLLYLTGKNTLEPSNIGSLCEFYKFIKFLINTKIPTMLKRLSWLGGLKRKEQITLMHELVQYVVMQKKHWWCRFTPYKDDIIPFVGIQCFFRMSKVFHWSLDWVKIWSLDIVVKNVLTNNLKKQYK